LSEPRTGALLLPPALALLLLGAHFLRAALVPLTVACLGLLALLFVRTRWAWVSLQVALVILGSVALVTALAALALRTRTARDYFGSPR